jgi:DNA helicase-2/ATP-dependent DNA helicase PcrA
MKFTENQLKAINKIDGNATIIAAAGSGKTSIVTNRILNLIENHDINPANILAITFSRKAKENMENRLKTMINSFSDVNIETFHSLALKIIQYKYGRLYKLWEVKWEKEKVINDICKKLTGCTPEEYNEIIKFITLQKINMLKPEDNLIYSKKYIYSNETMKKIYSEYEKYKESNNLIEYDDFLNFACEILETDQKILTHYRNKFKFILSDEYQDVSKNQEKLIRLIGQDSNVFVVGDPLQSIYSFRGGESKHLLDFDTVWGNTEIINLDTNFRCSEDIIKTANKFAESLPESKHKTFIKSKANNPKYKKPTFIKYNTAYDECIGIVKEIKKLHIVGEEYKDIAILARTNAQLQKFETILHSSKIPFNVVDGKLLMELPEIQLIIQYLNLSINKYDNEAFRYVYNKPLRWLDKAFLSEVESISGFNDSLYINMDKIRRRNWRYKTHIDEFYETIFPTLSPLSSKYNKSRELIEIAKTKGYQLVLATNPVFPRRAIEHRLQWAGLASHDFDLITSYENMHFCKPHVDK